MTLKVCIRFLILVAATVAAGAPCRGAVLSYSGDDIAAGPGTLTIRCSEGKRGLWELDLKRPKGAPSIQITRFDDLTDKSDFNYAPAGDQYSLLVAHLSSRLGADSFSELRKAEDCYTYSLREAAGTLTVVTTYRINAATKAGTQIVATRRLVNTSGKQVAPAPTSMMDATMSLGVAGYDGRRKDGGCSLSKYDDKGRCRHKQRNGEDAIWVVTDNLNKGWNKKFDPKGHLWCQAEVTRSSATRKLGLVVGRTFRLTTDIVGFYPASNVGGVKLDSTATYMEGLHFLVTPREWLGQKREDHNKVGIPADGLVTKTFTLEINISFK